MLLQIEFENSNRVPQKFESRKRYLATIYDTMMKPIHDVNLTKHSKGYLKIKLKSRLSILILSKADPSQGYNIPLTKHARFVKALGFFC